MILVTGGTGFIGTHLVRRLTASGQAVRCLVRRQARPRNLPAGVEAVYGNLISGEGLPESTWRASPRHLRRPITTPETRAPRATWQARWPARLPAVGRAWCT
jgi:NAD(P)-dependent dehydrogenase (short-subunit alcohol dehydrogenase family)